jgi:hypothetical protein
MVQIQALTAGRAGGPGVHTEFTEEGVSHGIFYVC